MNEKLKTAFEYAIETNNTEVFDALAKDFASFPQEDKEWLLEHTIRTAQSTDFIQHVLDYGYSLDYKDNDDTTLLHYAAMSNNPETVRFFIECGIDVNAKELHGWTPILFAARNTGSVEVLKTLIEAGADTTVHAHNTLLEWLEIGFSLLHIAAAFNPAPDVTKFLLEQGFDIEDSSNEYKLTPLLFAAREQSNVEVFTLLMEAGADPFARDECNNDLLSCAAENPSSEIMRYILSTFSVCQFESDGYAALTDALHSGSSPEVVTLLLRAIRTELMRTAVDNENPGILDALLRAGYDANTADSDGTTAMMWAADHSQGIPDTIAMLRKNGALWNAVDNEGRNTLHYAAANDEHDLYEWMLNDNDFKTLAEQKDKRGHKPIYYRMNRDDF